MRKTLFVAAVMLAFTAQIGVAHATIIGTFNNGDASVTFDLTGNVLTKTVTNLETVAAVANTLTGLINTFSVPETITLTTGTAPGTATCTGSGNSTTCTTSAGSTNALGSPFFWAASGSGTTTDHLEAGNGSFKPGGIVNSTIVTFGKDGLGDAPHNPYLLGPVVFTETLSNTNFTITGLSFEFGTVPNVECVLGCTPVPEPTTLLLLGFGLAGVGGVAWCGHRRRS